MLAGWKRRAREVKQEVYALYFACRDPRTPRIAKVLAAVVVGYALSPIDLIPDFIPVLGYLDDLILLPLGVIAVRAMVPATVMVDCREKANRLDGKPASWLAAAAIVLIWISAGAAALVWLLYWRAA